MFVHKIVALLLLSFALLHGNQNNKKVVFNCKSGETAQFIKMLNSAEHLVENYESEKIPYTISVLTQSECVKFMLSDLDGTKWATEEVPFEAELKLDKLKSKVKFEQCEHTLNKMGIQKKKLRKFVKTVPSATIQLVDYQLSGYAVLNQ